VEKNKGEDEGGGGGGDDDDDEDDDEEEEEEEKEGRKEGRKERAKGPHTPHAGAKKRANLLNLWEQMNSGLIPVERKSSHCFLLLVVNLRPKCRSLL
jgi:hypothetical protein